MQAFGDTAAGYAMRIERLYTRAKYDMQESELMAAIHGLKAMSDAGACGAYYFAAIMNKQFNKGRHAH